MTVLYTLYMNILENRMTRPFFASFLLYYTYDSSETNARLPDSVVQIINTGRSNIAVFCRCTHPTDAQEH